MKRSNKMTAADHAANVAKKIERRRVVAEQIYAKRVGLDEKEKLDTAEPTVKGKRRYRDVGAVGNSWHGQRKGKRPS